MGYTTKGRLFQIQVHPETEKMTAQIEVELDEWAFTEMREKVGEEVKVVIGD